MKAKRRSVLITGGGGGIGLSIAREFLSSGVSVGLLDRDLDGLRRAASELTDQFPGAGVFVAHADVTDDSALRQAVEELVTSLGGLDTLIVNAGVMSRVLFEDLDTSTLAEALDINVLGAFRTVVAALPSLKRSVSSPSIVTISSAGGLNPRSITGPAYRVSKAALIALTKVLAVELLPDRIRVNCVAPGGVDGGMSTAFSGDELRAMREAALESRLATTQEIARSTVFLAGSESSFTTGHVLVVAGGAFI